MVVASCRITLHLEEARSLKEKRKVAKGMVRMLRQRHNVSASEVDAQDLWRKAALGLALAAPDRPEAEKRLRRALQDVEQRSGVKYLDFETEFRDA